MSQVTIIVLKKDGVRRAGETLKPGEHVVSRGPHLSAWLRFGEVKIKDAAPSERSEEGEETKKEHELTQLLGRLDDIRQKQNESAASTEAAEVIPAATESAPIADVALPEAAPQSDIAHEAPAPEVTAPEVATPADPAPEAAAPEAAAPEAAAPEAAELPSPAASTPSAKQSRKRK